MQSDVYLMDCMALLSNLATGSIALGIIDIPYGKNVGNMAYLKEQKGCKVKVNSKKIYTQKNWDLETPNQAFYNELRRVCRHQIIFGTQYTNWTGLGSGQIVWDKMFSEKVSFGRYEKAYCSFIEGQITKQLLWAGLCQAKSLSEPTTQQGNKKLNEKRIHPCHKPIMLYQWLIRLAQKHGVLRQGQTILDTHLGGGSSRIAAYLEGFNFIGSEIDSEYFSLQEQRFYAFEADYKEKSKQLTIGI